MKIEFYWNDSTRQLFWRMAKQLTLLVVSQCEDAVGIGEEDGVIGSASDLNNFGVETERDRRVDRD